MTGAIVATSILFFPAAPLFLFMHGKDITIPKGTEITAYINGDAPLDPARFAPKVANSEPSPEAVTPGGGRALNHNHQVDPRWRRYHGRR
jgi:hypothetical protein